MQPSTPPFDFIDAMTEAYGFLWRNRRIILLLAFIPLLIKVACLVVIFALDLETAYLRQGLLNLPAYFAEGALLCRLVVMAGKNGKTIAPLPAANNRLVMAATLLYVLIKLAQAFAGGLGMEFAMHQQVQEENAEGSASLFFASLFLLGFTIWAFRLVWLYIPLVQGYSMIEFLHRIRGMKTSFVMIGTWLLCFVPLALLLIIVAGLLGDMLGHSEETPSNIYRFLIIFMQSGLELVAVILSTLAIGFGVHSIMSGGAPKPRNKDLA